ncbi:retrotransposon hot spot (RHS) protein, putative, partial [Trypanosoma cruzi marinkellei]
GLVMVSCSVSGVGSDAAARHLSGSKERPQWTMSSTVQDILLEGNTPSTKMKLNDFLLNYFGGMAVVEGYNVAMEGFVQQLDDYVQEQRLLRRIFNLREYRELETISKLCDEGVFSLRQWREYEGKDTVTPVAKGKLDAALTQVLAEARREAEERAWQEKELNFTISTKIKEVLLKGRVRVKEMKLSEFLTMELDGRGVLRANRDVQLEKFFKDSKKYFRNKGVLNEIQTTDR